jgi:poly [ADP-ribose] polymerase
MRKPNNSHTNPITVNQIFVELISTIFDKDMMKRALETMKIDVKKMPLGKIKQSQIRGIQFSSFISFHFISFYSTPFLFLIEGYKVLTEIQDILQAPTPNQTLLKDATNKFYTVCLSG